MNALHKDRSSEKIWGHLKNGKNYANQNMLMSCAADLECHIGYVWGALYGWEE